MERRLREISLDAYDRLIGLASWPIWRWTPLVTKAQKAVGRKRAKSGRPGQRGHQAHIRWWMLKASSLQAVAAARLVEELVGQRSMHVVLAGDFDADPDAASVRFWCGRQSLGGMSVCYRDAWESTHPGDPGHTFTPSNPLMATPDWPFRRIDYIFVR